MRGDLTEAGLKEDLPGCIESCHYKFIVCRIGMNAFHFLIKFKDYIQTIKILLSFYTCVLHTLHSSFLIKIYYLDSFNSSGFSNICSLSSCVNPKLANWLLGSMLVDTTMFYATPNTNFYNNNNNYCLTISQTSIRPTIQFQKKKKLEGTNTLSHKITILINPINRFKKYLTNYKFLNIHPCFPT